MFGKFLTRILRATMGTKFIVEVRPHHQGAALEVWPDTGEQPALDAARDAARADVQRRLADAADLAKREPPEIAEAAEARRRCDEVSRRLAAAEERLAATGEEFRAKVEAGLDTGPADELRAKLRGELGDLRERQSILARLAAQREAAARAAQLSLFERERALIAEDAAAGRDAALADLKAVVGPAVLRYLAALAAVAAVPTTTTDDRVFGAAPIDAVENWPADTLLTASQDFVIADGSDSGRGRAVKQGERLTVGELPSVLPVKTGLLVRAD